MSADMKIEGTLHLEIRTKFELKPTSELLCFKGRILLESVDGDYVVGEVKYYVARVFELDNPLWDLDAISSDTEEYCEFFNSELDNWSDAILKVWPEAMFGDLVILDRVIVYPPFRGQEIGLKCLGALTRFVSEGKLFVMRPMPLQYLEGYVNNPNIARHVKNEKIDIRKLAAYYAKAGFRKISGTGRMAFDGCAVSPLDDKENCGEWVSFMKTPAMDAYRLPESKDEE